MRGHEPVADTGQQLGRLPPWPELLQPQSQRAAVEQLGHHILPILELAGIEDGDEVRVIERRGQLGFALEPAAPGRVRQIIGEELHGDRPVELRIDRAVDDAHPAFAENVFDAIDGHHRARHEAAFLRQATFARHGGVSVARSSLALPLPRRAGPDRATAETFARSDMPLSA